MSSDLESSHCALSIGCSCKAKYQSFVNRLNKIDPYILLVEPRIDIPNRIIFEKEKSMVVTRQPFESSFQAVPISTINTARPRYRSHSRKDSTFNAVPSVTVGTGESNASLKNDHLNQHHPDSWYDVYQTLR